MDSCSLTTKLLHASSEVRRLRADQNRDGARLLYWLSERDHLLEQLSAQMRQRVVA
jgi:hypothetical protein